MDKERRTEKNTLAKTERWGQKTERHTERDRASELARRRNLEGRPPPSGQRTRAVRGGGQGGPIIGQRDSSAGQGRPPALPQRETRLWEKKGHRLGPPFPSEAGL